MENSFKREVIVNFNQPEIETSVDIDVNVQVENNLVFVTEVLDYQQKYKGETEVTANIKMVGVFEKIGDPTLDINEFGNINGAAIIFPYIREHLTNLSAKSGIGLIVLPPFNFTKNKFSRN
ncbi:MAG: protein-export chaperone SecB [Algoriphagus aquaeductus]|uniref:protein-export chaperone SecB n=1 Tax=Algoriphagus aquaeductus TaxID=475299 RepID=UPI003879D900